jgi:hypothetical protein
MRQRFAFHHLLLVAFLTSAGAMACSTPVYRYALEHWEPDSYILDVRSAPGGIVGELKQALAELGGRTDVNIAVHEVPGAEGDATFTLRFPHAPPAQAAVISLPATKASLALLTDSPVRAELAKRLLAGETAVFVFLESGDAAKDKEVLARLERIVGDLEKNLELPAQAPADTLAPGEEAAAGDLRVDFSILRVRRDDPKEAVLVASLLATEPDLRDLKGPMAFPVFGRGRALYAIVDKGINAEVLYEAGAFMTGACSCQVKAQNPGVDLPMTAAWDSIFKDVVYEEVQLPPLTAISVADTAEDAVQSEPPMAGEEAMAPPSEGTEALPKSMGVPRYIFVALVLVAVLGSLALLSRQRGA